MQLDLIIPATVTPAVILVGVTFTLVLLIVYFIAKKSSRTKNEPDQWYTLPFNNKTTWYIKQPNNYKEWGSLRSPTPCL